MTLRTEKQSSYCFFKLNMEATECPFTQSDATRLRTALAKEGFDDIRIPELPQASSTLVCIAYFPTDCGTILADLVSFVTRHKSDFPAGLATRLAVGDFAGNETHRRLELAAEDGCLKILF